MNDSSLRNLNMQIKCRESCSRTYLIKTIWTRSFNLSGFHLRIAVSYELPNSSISHVRLGILVTGRRILNTTDRFSDNYWRYEPAGSTGSFPSRPTTGSEDYLDIENYAPVLNWNWFWSQISMCSPYAELLQGCDRAGIRRLKNRELQEKKTFLEILFGLYEIQQLLATHLSKVRHRSNHRFKPHLLSFLGWLILHPIH